MALNGYTCCLIHLFTKNIDDFNVYTTAEENVHSRFIRMLNHLKANHPLWFRPKRNLNLPLFVATYFCSAFGNVLRVRKSRMMGVLHGGCRYTILMSLEKAKIYFKKNPIGFKPTVMIYINIPLSTLDKICLHCICLCNKNVQTMQWNTFKSNDRQITAGCRLRLNLTKWRNTRYLWDRFYFIVFF